VKVQEGSSTNMGNNYNRKMYRRHCNELGTIPTESVPIGLRKSTI